MPGRACRFLSVALLLLVVTTRAAAADGVEEALRHCLVGRSPQGQSLAGRMPPYNLGYGYTCDRARAQAYLTCRSNPANSQAACENVGDAERNRCRNDVCTYVYNQCHADRCRIGSNDYECWHNSQFGFFTRQNGQWYFAAVHGIEVHPQHWQAVCNGRFQRCQSGAPITPRFGSAGTYGHNCHHAASDVGQCLTGRGVPDVQVVVFDGPYVMPDPAGNLDHAMLTVPHPTDSGKRCLVESQKRAPDAGSPIDPRCCYTNASGFRGLPEAECPVAFFGPLRQALPMARARTYPNPAAFLRERGVGSD